MKKGWRNRVDREGEGRYTTGEGVAPTVERWTPNPTVVGSNPTALTFFHPFLFTLIINSQSIHLLIFHSYHTLKSLV